MKDATCGKAIEKLEAPDEVVIPMSLHIGAPCTPIVAVGDTVKLGQKIGEATGFVSSPVHASVSGTVVAVELRPHFNGTDGMAVVIQNDHQDTLSEDVKPVEHPESLSGEQLAEIVKNAGIVGCGGATFPYPCEDPWRSWQSGYGDHQRSRMRTLHYVRSPHYAGNA